MADTTKQYRISQTLFDRYIIIIERDAALVSVYCESCEEWAAEFELQSVHSDSETDLLEKIVESHEDDFSDVVSFER
jgi:hypothetical protein